jgi:hypothetical protein
MDSVAIKRRPVRRQIPYRDAYRAVLAGLLLIFVFAASFYDRQWFGASKDTAYTLGESGDHPLRTGSILFVPASGNRCRHRLLDNQTWFIRDNGFINCGELVNRGVETIGPEYNSNTRLDAIRDAFSRKR